MVIQRQIKAERRQAREITRGVVAVMNTWGGEDKGLKAYMAED